MEWKITFGPPDGICECSDCGTKHHILESCPMCGGGPAPYITDPKDYPLWGIRETNNKVKKLLKRKR
jgi:primosomal protein N'